MFIITQQHVTSNAIDLDNLDLLKIVHTTSLFAISKLHGRTLHKNYLKPLKRISNTLGLQVIHIFTVGKWYVFILIINSSSSSA